MVSARMVDTMFFKIYTKYFEIVCEYHQFISH